MVKKLLFILVVVLSIITFSNLAWSSVVGTWEMTGKITTTIKAKGMKSKTLKGTLDGDSWTFNSDNSFESDNIGGTWSQNKTKVTVNLDTDDIISFFEEMLSEELETDISVDAITKNTCTATENTKNKTTKGSFKIYMNIAGHDEDCDCERTGKATVSGSFTGTLLQPPTVDISEYWKIYHTPKGSSEKGPDYLNLSQSGNKIIGTMISGTGDNEGKELDISGTISGASVSLFFNSNGDVSMKGSADTNTMNGTYKESSGDSGTWRTERTASIPIF
jgi:hypothetical protein